MWFLGSAVKQQTHALRLWHFICGFFFNLQRLGVAGRERGGLRSNSSRTTRFLDWNALTFQAALPLNPLPDQHARKLCGLPCWRSEINLPIVCRLSWTETRPFHLTVLCQRRRKTTPMQSCRNTRKMFFCLAANIFLPLVSNIKCV